MRFLRLPIRKTQPVILPATSRLVEQWLELRESAHQDRKNRMEITRIDDAVTYEAPKHFKMIARRLQGGDATNAEHVSVAYSTFMPGGGAESGATPFEKVYVVMEGEISVTVDAGTFLLKKYDSCRIEPDESRTMLNESDAPAEVLVIIPTV